MLSGSSGPRSNTYSESKFSNWTEYDPHYLEIGSIPNKLKEKENFMDIKIYKLPGNSKFIQPCEPHDIISVLQRVPENFIKGLKSIFLMGGTKKQSNVKFATKLVYGMYQSSSIYLFAYPSHMMHLVYRQLPPPHIMKDYHLCHAAICQKNKNWNITLSKLGLKNFYLYDVLLHEIGHHVDKRIEKRSIDSAERWAYWFASVRKRYLGSAVNKTDELIF